ncbi:MAG: SUMF1/EgtB/PvdO family nonheme iron enzyme [Blastocatellia bacterium]
MPKANDRIGPYQLIRKLGEGGFGEVWLAQDFTGSTPREFAVKIPLESEIDLDALLQEATLWARATGHPNVLEFLAARVFDGQVVLVSEYAPDGSLKDWLRRHGGRAPSVEAAVEMTRGILAGLEHLHARNIIDRDVKPDNVLLLDATPRLADFGISRVLKSTSKSAVTAGTPLYMAPEAFNRKRNQQTDLWSVGVMLYQMLSGSLPFDGADLTELYGAICNEESEPLPTAIPEWLQQVVAKALIKDPERRYQTAAEMRAALAPHLPTVKEEHAPPIELPPKRGSTVIEPHSRLKPVRAKQLRSAAKWGAGLVAVIWIALTTYLAIKTPSSSTPNLLNSPSNAQTSPNLGAAFTEDLNGVKLEMVRVAGGSFLMGSPQNEAERDDIDAFMRNKREGPQHRVSVSAFYMGRYEISQAQWKAVMGSNPSSFTGDDLPAEMVSWNDAKAFREKLGQMTGKPYRLPSEAEWEYACRAGTAGDYAGDLPAKSQFGDDDFAKFLAEKRHLDGMAWYDNNSRSKTNPVGKKRPNAFKLYDMHGNVWEWCEDVWHDGYGGQHGNPPGDGRAWLTGGEQNLRALRGGSWNNDSQSVRSAYRDSGATSDRGSNIGFRVAVFARTQ